MALSTQIYFSSTEILIETKDSGIIDVSNDVVSCRVTRRMDAVSTADISLNNNASVMRGKYNDTISVGDRVSVSFMKNGTRVPQLTGRVNDVPIFGVHQSTFDFTVADVIEDLNYIYWDPYSTEAYTKYMLDSRALADETNDNGAGSRIYTFLQDVCGFDKSMVKVATFPGTEGTVKTILDMTVNNNQIDKDQEAEKMYKLFFGMSNMLDGTGSDTDAAGNGMLSPNSTTSSDNQAKIVNKILGTNEKSGESKDTVAFDSTQGTKVFRQTWSQHDNASIHTGLYGLSKEQMNKHAGVNAHAKDCSSDKQTRAMTSIMGAMKGSISSNVWYYFNGFGLTFNSGGNINYQGHGRLYLHGTPINTKSDWEDALNSAISGVGLKAPANTGKDKTLNKSKVPAPKDTKDSGGETKADAGTQAKWDAFYRAHHAGMPQVDADGFAGAQCWDLYLLYCEAIFGKRPSLQPPGGNGAYYRNFPGGEPILADQMVKLGPKDKAQRGDIVFWQWSGPGGDRTYGHVAIVESDDGNTFTVIEQGQGFGSKVHEGKYDRSTGILSGFLRPKMFGGNLQATDGTDGGSGGSSMSEAELAARNEGLKLFKFFQYDNQQEMLRSNLLAGDVAMKNDEPAINFVRSLCKSTMRSFMSLPDGSFAAFVPDWFGYMTPSNAKNNIIPIPTVEVKDFNVRFSKSSYVSHLYLTTAEHSVSYFGETQQFPMSQLAQDMASSGTMSLEKQGDRLLGLMDISATHCSSTQEVMQRFGVSVKTETDAYIIDHTMTSISALYRFLRYWANAFKTTVKIGFRPEIMPGHRLYIECANTTVFVETITHSWSATNGGSTDVSVVAPVSGDGKVGA